MEYFKYRYKNKIDFSITKGNHVSVIGNSNDFVISTFLEYNKECNIFIGGKELTGDNLHSIYKDVAIVLYKHLNVFLGETVLDEVVFGLESQGIKKDDMTSLVLSQSKMFKIDILHFGYISFSLM